MRQRPRIYAYLSSGEYAGQTITLRSVANLDKYAPGAQSIWLSGTMTVYDLIRRT